MPTSQPMIPILWGLNPEGLPHQRYYCKFPGDFQQTYHGTESEAYQTAIHMRNGMYKNGIATFIGRKDLTEGQTAANL